MRVSLLTIPVEPPRKEFEYVASSDTETLSHKSRSDGTFPISPKIAIVSIVKWMERHGFTSWDFYDVDMLLPSDEELADYFRKYNPTVVGLSAVVSTCYAQVNRISRILRSVCPEAWIVLGGSLTASANLCLRKTHVDLCVVGDGEITWVEFLEYVKRYGRDKNYEALAKIQGLAYLDDHDELISTGYGRAIPAEDNPFPDYDILLAGLKDHPEALNNYFRPGLGTQHFQTDPRSFDPHRRPNIAGFWSSKGCVARCTFCQRSTKGYRVQGLPALEDHLTLLKERFDVGFVQIIDENFGSDKEYAYEFSRIMKKHDFLWVVGGVRCKSVTYEDAKFYKEHNCSSLKFGVESGSQKMLDVMEKKFTVRDVTNALKACADLEICSHLGIMVGMPGETNETVMETGRFLGRMAHMQGAAEPKYLGISIFYALPLPGTPLYVYGQQIGVIGKTPDEEEKFLLSVSGTGASKTNYVNMNGSKLKDVVFWDWLVLLEARRAFYELERKNPHKEVSFLSRAFMGNPIKEKEIVGHPTTLGRILTLYREEGWRGFKVKMFYMMDQILKRILLRDIVNRLPRWLVYGFAKNAVYFEFLVQKAILRLFGGDFNLYRYHGRVKPLPDNVIVTERHNRSIRTVVKETSRMLPPKSMTEANQDLLAIGL